MELLKPWIKVTDDLYCLPSLQLFEKPCNAPQSLSRCDRVLFFIGEKSGVISFELNNINTATYSLPLLQVFFTEKKDCIPKMKKRIESFLKDPLIPASKKIILDALSNNILLETN